MICNRRPCCRGEADDTRDVTLVFKRDQLLYDINNYAYVEGHIMGDDNECRKHTTIDVGQEGNVDRVTRILGVVHAAVVEMLYPYTKNSVEEETIDDDFWQPDEYVIKMHVPASMSQTTTHLLSKLIHEYMVYRVLADWLSITNVEAAANWMAKADSTAAEINRTKNFRRGKIRITLHPF